MRRNLKPWLFRLLLAMAVAFIAAYATDWAIFRLRGSPCSTITVNHYLSVPLKDRKVEYDFTGATPVPCAIALFPQAGDDPCWLIWRKRNTWDAP